jgi:HD-like signal output (HDOD) protein
MVNSAFFGLFRKVTTATEAVRYLGIETIKALVLSVHLFQEMPCRGFGEAWGAALWDHSITTAYLSKKIATLETGDPGISNSAFTAGLLHDSGRLILATCLPEEYGRLLQGPAQSPSPLWLREKDALGASHQEVGAYLLGIWGLPDDIVGAVASHHIPSTSIVQGGFSPLAAVHIAEALLSEGEEGRNDSESPPWDIGFLRSSGIPEHGEQWVRLYQETVGEGQDEI